MDGAHGFHQPPLPRLAARGRCGGKALVKDLQGLRGKGAERFGGGDGLTSGKESKFNQNPFKIHL